MYMRMCKEKQLYQKQNILHGHFFMQKGEGTLSEITG